MQQVAQVVGQVAVNALHQGLFREVPVQAKGDLPEQEVSEGIRPVTTGHVEGVHHVTLGLGHLLSLHGPPPVGKDHYWRIQPQGHHHGGPDDGVETDDVFAHQVVHRRPVALPKPSLVGVAQGGEVVDEGIEPDVDHVPGVLRHGHTPRNGGPGNGLIHQTSPDEADDLVVSPPGLHRLGVGLIERKQRGGVFGQAEEIALLRHLLQLPFAVRTGAIFPHLGFGDVGFTGDAIPPFVAPLVDVPLGQEFGEDVLDHPLVPLLRGPDEVVVLDAQHLP
ncbi:MAG: hypothetical protein BWY88_00921 [Synergistetes bacterium ADurb.Bin520]|nr:MAG: hypothetical protein BWY88_00921 [Synergistetes bacterium ADurb.Bin520]